MTKNNEVSSAGWNLDNSYACLPKIFHSEQKPSPVASPQLVILNHSLAASLGLEGEMLAGEKGVAIFAGNQIPEGAFPLAQAYAGHQFGHFTMLGDGRAILLGEQITPQGARFDIQLKGSGRTPYSRGGDGRAVLGPMLREYIISEAMYALGIPTTRSLAVVTTGENVLRESALPGAVLTRVAKSHLRVGTFQYATQWGSVTELQALADYTINRHYPEVENIENKYLALLKEVIKKQAELVAKWQLVGFIHGVMNTDNMTISGETIDYGPCAFMDTYNPETVFSSIDRHGRYAYGNQPTIAQWNLARFAETLLPLLDNNQDQAVKIAQTALTDFTAIFSAKWLTGMRSKLGLFNEEAEDQALIDGLLDTMGKNKADYTNTFRALTLGLPEKTGMFKSPEFRVWQQSWQARLKRQSERKVLSEQLMRENNPVIIPRNHRVEEALEVAEKQGDYTVLARLNAVLAKPYAYLPEQEEYAILPEPTSCTYRTFCGT